MVEVSACRDQERENIGFVACIHVQHNYAITMRTTLILQDQLAIAAKRVAAERRVSLSEVVNQALRHELYGNQPKAAAGKFQMPVFGNPISQATDSSPADFDRFLHDDTGIPS